MNETEVIRVRYWAAARAAAGVAEETVDVQGGISLDVLRRELERRHPGTRLSEVIAVCSVLVGDQPVGSRDARTVEVPGGATVEFLPPFAGG